MSTKWWFGAFRDRGAPTWYGDNRTPVVTDPTTVKIAISFGIFLVAFLVVFPGIRRTKWTSFLTTTLALIVGALLIICTYYPSWHVAEVWIMTPYRSFSSERVNALLGVNVGLKYVNITLKGYPEGKFERHMNYNERFAFDEVKSMQNDLRGGLQKGLPYPILSVIEYFSVDKAGFTWGRRYRLAGYYTCILLWLSFALWLLHLIVLCLVPQFYARILMCLGSCILLADLVFVMSCPKTLYMPFHTTRGYTEFLVFEFGWCLWATLAGGFTCFIYGVLIRVLELRTSYQFFTFVHEYDERFDDAQKIPWSWRPCRPISAKGVQTLKPLSTNPAMTSLASIGRPRFDESTVAKFRPPPVVRTLPPATDEAQPSPSTTLADFNERLERRCSTVSCRKAELLAPPVIVRRQRIESKSVMSGSESSSSIDSSVTDRQAVACEISKNRLGPSLSFVEHCDVFVQSPSSADSDPSQGVYDGSSQASWKSSRKRNREKPRPTNRLKALLSSKKSADSTTSTAASISDGSFAGAAAIGIALEEVVTSGATAESDQYKQSTKKPSQTRPVDISLVVDDDEEVFRPSLDPSPSGALYDAGAESPTSATHAPGRSSLSSHNKSADIDANSSNSDQSPSLSHSLCLAATSSRVYPHSYQHGAPHTPLIVRSTSRCVTRRPSASKLHRRCSNLTSYSTANQNLCYKNSTEPYRSEFIDLSFPAFDSKPLTDSPSRLADSSAADRTSSCGSSVADHRSNGDFSAVDCMDSEHRSVEGIPSVSDPTVADCDRDNNDRHYAAPHKFSDDWSAADCATTCDWSPTDRRKNDAWHISNFSAKTANNRSNCNLAANDVEVEKSGKRESTEPSKSVALNRRRVRNYVGSNCQVSKLQRRPSNPHPLQCKIVERSATMLLRP